MAYNKNPNNRAVCAIVRIGPGNQKKSDDLAFRLVVFARRHGGTWLAPHHPRPSYGTLIPGQTSTQAAPASTHLGVFWTALGTAPAWRDLKSQRIDPTKAACTLGARWGRTWCARDVACWVSQTNGTPMAVAHTRTQRVVHSGTAKHRPRTTILAHTRTHEHTMHNMTLQGGMTYLQILGATPQQHLA